MEFTQLSFLYLWLPVSLAAYFSAKKLRTKNTILLCASLIFYAMGQPFYLALLVGLSWLNFQLAKKIRPEKRMTLIVPVAINDLEDLRKKLEIYNSGDFKTAGFLHEIVLMNYGAIALEKEYLQKAHALCRAYDTLCLVDEIQSCAWYPEQMLFRRYGLQPDFVVVGKGFPGGENSGSKILCKAEADNLVLFGALITNGQEELTNLSYLTTMQFIADQAEELTRLQKRWDTIGQTLAQDYPDVLTGAEGLGYLASLQFADAQQAGVFAQKLTGRCIDTSAQLYKANCPPAALFKLPIIMQDADIDILEANIREVLQEMKETV